MSDFGQHWITFFAFFFARHVERGTLGIESNLVRFALPNVNPILKRKSAHTYIQGYAWENLRVLRVSWGNLRVITELSETSARGLCRALLGVEEAEVRDLEFVDKILRRLDCALMRVLSNQTSLACAWRRALFENT